MDRARGLFGLVELRADFLAPSERRGTARFAQQCSSPAILTVRRRDDGGHFIGTESDRLRLLHAGLRGAYRYVDLENDLPAAAVAVPRQVAVIRSYHSAGGTPYNLEMQAAACSRHSAEIPKVAVRPRSVEDLQRVIALGQRLRRPHIVVAIGEYGVATRLLAQRLGSLLTYGSSGANIGAPGHMSPADLVRGYRVPEVSGATHVFGVAGYPIAHSRSPRIHNTGYRYDDTDAIYVPFYGERLTPLLRCADMLGVRGLSVTIPHKHEAARVANWSDASVAATSACNTLVRRANGWCGYNTDVEGFIEPLRSRRLLGRGQGAGGVVSAALVIGAGGAARAAVFALQQAGVNVLIAGRTVARARQLAATFDAEAVALTAADLLDRAAPYLELVVQASSAGMAPNDGVDPIANIPLTGAETVYDMVYAPEETALLARARAAGCQTISGMEMLFAQGFAQYRLFTGRRYPMAAARELGVPKVGQGLLESGAK